MLMFAGGMVVAYGALLGAALGLWGGRFVGREGMIGSVNVEQRLRGDGWEDGRSSSSSGEDESSSEEERSSE